MCHGASGAGDHPFAAPLKLRSSVCPSSDHAMMSTSPGFWGALSGYEARWLATTHLCNIGCICLLLPDCGNLQIIAKSAGLIGLWCICTDG